MKKEEIKQLLCKVNNWNFENKYHNIKKYIYTEIINKISAESLSNALSSENSQAMFSEPISAVY